MFDKVKLKKATNKCDEYFKEKEEYDDYFSLLKQNRVDVVAL